LSRWLCRSSAIGGCTSSTPCSDPIRSLRNTYAYARHCTRLPERAACVRLVVSPSLRQIKREVRAGIPAEIRGLYWQTVTGAKVRCSLPCLCRRLICGVCCLSSRVRDCVHSCRVVHQGCLEKNPDLYGTLIQMPSSYEDKILKDVTRTMPHLMFFRKKDGAGCAPMQSTPCVCVCVCVNDPRRRNCVAARSLSSDPCSSRVRVFQATSALQRAQGLQCVGQGAGLLPVHVIHRRHSSPVHARAGTGHHSRPRGTRQFLITPMRACDC
jgi:hypothetical protein